MIQAIRTRLDSKERGFTLIELMVVVLIIAILIAIAIPTFLGARTKSQDRAAQSNLRQALSTFKVHYTDANTYVATATQLTALEPSQTWDPTIGNTSETVTGFLASSSNVVIALKSKSGTFFCITDSTTGPSDKGQGSTIGAIDTVAECNATATW